MIDMAPAAGGTPGFLSAASDEAAARERLRSSGSLEVIMTEVLIPARQGRAVRVSRGAVVDVINTHGAQAVDFWALASPDASEHLSMEHTRIAIGRLMPRVGDTLVSNARRPLLTVVEDTS